METGDLEAGGSGDQVRAEGVRDGPREGAPFGNLAATGDAGTITGCHLIVVFKTKHAMWADGGKMIGDRIGLPRGQ